MRLLLLALLCLPAGAGVVDRVAVVVGKSVITESEVDQQVRLTEFLNQTPLDLSPEPRRAAAERLVDQELIRNEMKLGNYPKPTPEEADAVLRKFREEHLPDDAQFKAALAKYGLTEEELKGHLLWQVAVIRFTDLRFQTGLAPVPEQGANRADDSASAPPAPSVDQQMDTWLKDARSQTRIQFKKAAFQ